jgi:hypothetical protein
VSARPKDAIETIQCVTRNPSVEYIQDYVPPLEVDEEPNGQPVPVVEPVGDAPEDVQQWPEAEQVAPAIYVPPPVQRFVFSAFANCD